MQRFLLGSFIVFVALAALFAASVTLFGEWDETYGKLFGTSTAVGLGTLFAMGCAVHAERRRGAALGRVGVAINAIAVVVILLRIWREEWFDHAEFWVWDPTIASVLWSAACMLWIPKLEGRGRWIQVVSTLCAAVVGVGCISLFHEWQPSDFEARLLITLGVVLAACAIAAPIVARLQAAQIAEAPMGETATIRVTTGLVRTLELVGPKPASWSNVALAILLPEDRVDAWLAREEGAHRAIRHPLGGGTTLVVLEGER